MSNRLTPKPTRRIRRILEKQGFVETPRGKGSHMVFEKWVDNEPIRVVVPNSREIPVGTIMSIIKQSGLNREDFM